MFKNFFLFILFTISISNFSFCMEEQQLQEQKNVNELDELFDDVVSLTKVNPEVLQHKYELPSWMNRVGYWFVLRYIALKNCSHKLYQNCKQKIEKLVGNCP
ncbi:hypothetical protein M1446_04405 [Candidatus Dependentiae bacterium]|nr:hypothetical protein [Candidatus Dependentiae bacterium]